MGPAAKPWRGLLATYRRMPRPPTVRSHAAVCPGTKRGLGAQTGLGLQWNIGDMQEPPQGRQSGGANTILRGMRPKAGC